MTSINGTLIQRMRLFFGDGDPDGGGHTSQVSGYHYSSVENNISSNVIFKNVSLTFKDIISSIFSTNGYHDDESEEESPQDEIWTPRVIFLTTVGCFIVIGNLIVIISIMTHRHLYRNTANYFICSLAFSDLLVGVTVFPLGILHETIFLKDDPKPGIFCHLVQAVLNITIFSSLWQMTIISTDRYLRITNPLNYKKRMNKSKALLVIIMMYLMTIAAEIIYLIELMIAKTDFGGKCLYFVLSSWRLLLFYYMIGMIPSSAMIYMYVRLYVLAKRGQQLRKTMEHEVSSSTIITTRINTTKSLMSGKKYYLKPQLVQYKAAIMIGVLIMIYFVSCTPCYIIYTYWFFCKSCIEESWMYYIYPWLGLMNSALNPIIYFSLSNDFRKVLHPIRNKFQKFYNYIVELEYVTSTG